MWGLNWVMYSNSDYLGLYSGYMGIAGRYAAGCQKSKLLVSLPGHRSIAATEI